MSRPKHATAMWVGRCGNQHCRMVHVDFIDEHDDVFASGTIAAEMLPSLIEKLRDYAYEIATENKA